MGNFAPILPTLISHHNARVATDKEFVWWSQDVAEFRAQREKKTISLNEADRRAERDADEAKKKARAAERKTLGLADARSDDDDGLQADERNVGQQVAAEEERKKHTDPLVRETGAILSDAITLLSADPRMAAQVLPVSHQATVWQ